MKIHTLNSCQGEVPATLELQYIQAVININPVKQYVYWEVVDKLSGNEIVHLAYNQDRKIETTWLGGKKGVLNTASGQSHLDAILRDIDILITELYNIFR